MSIEESTSGQPGALRVGMAGGSGLRWVVADVTEPLRSVRRRLDLSPLAAVALGRALAGAALLARLSFKTPATLSVDFRGDGPLRHVFAEATSEGSLRGLVGDPLIQNPPEVLPLAVGPALGRGLLKVRRERMGRSYESQVALVTGEIGTDLAHLLLQSEQIRSAILVGVLVRPEGIAAAGGIAIEALPGVEDEVVSRLETNIEVLGGPSRALEEGGLSALESQLLAGFDVEVLGETSLNYHCGCSREQLLGRLESLTDGDRAELVAAGEAIRTECAYCGEVYAYSPVELTSSNAEESEGAKP